MRGWAVARKRPYLRTLFGDTPAQSAKRASVNAPTLALHYNVYGWEIEVHMNTVVWHRSYSAHPCPTCTVLTSMAVNLNRAIKQE
jgi:hypothetical protein